jgi:hypothetical protein
MVVCKERSMVKIRDEYIHTEFTYDICIKCKQMFQYGTAKHHIGS